MKVVRIADKVFIGKKIIHAGVWRKDDDRMTYHAIYTDGKTGKSFAKRFNVTSITRDKGIQHHIRVPPNEGLVLHRQSQW